MMFVGFLGCYGAIQESQCLLGTVRDTKPCKSLGTLISLPDMVVLPFLGCFPTSGAGRMCEHIGGKVTFAISPMVWMSYQAPTKPSFLPGVPYSIPSHSVSRLPEVVLVLLRNHLLFLSVWTRKQQRLSIIS